MTSLKVSLHIICRTKIALTYFVRLGDFIIMVKRMLVDASHTEEIRVVVANGTRLEEFDFESAEREQLKGNIYLAKVMRVEPSLQAAFVDYGGNRHGFLPFSEIHPDYYQIPVEDREALFKEQEEASKNHDSEDIDIQENNSALPEKTNLPVIKSNPAEPKVENDNFDTDTNNDSAIIGDIQEEKSQKQKNNSSDEMVEEIGGDELDDIEQRRARASRSLLGRRYKIQEVIKKRQILLVQVVKEERGNKGAALTTYLSLAGRYCVLMPNSVRGGGISRKITSQEDRRRLKSILSDLQVPAQMGVIVRTAGTARSKAEIRRDFEYLMRQWDMIREQTLNSIAPDLIYEEGNLIKRSIRDLYTRDVEQILVDGEEGYRVAKDFMRMLIPSHTSKVQRYKDRIPLFSRYQIDSQLDSMYSPEVKLKSGGYLVINSTEALVAIDVNSGRATRERNVEETALKTNLEAASEVARQLRLRDLAGLIVVDFIDMEGIRNQRSVERKLKESMRVDRARIQIGRISPFGLLEMSRQRLRPSITESSMEICPTCSGTGIVRSIGSSAVHVLRAIEEEGLRNRSSAIRVNLPAQVAYYILNNKRQQLSSIEKVCGFVVDFKEDSSLMPPLYKISRTKVKSGETVEEDITTLDNSISSSDSSENLPEKGKKRRRRRRQLKNDLPIKDAKPSEDIEEGNSIGTDLENEDKSEISPEVNQDEDTNEIKKRRRGKRGGRRRASKHDEDNKIIQSHNDKMNNEAKEETGIEALSSNLKEPSSDIKIEKNNINKPNKITKKTDNITKSVKPKKIKQIKDNEKSNSKTAKTNKNESINNLEKGDAKKIKLKSDQKKSPDVSANKIKEKTKKTDKEIPKKKKPAKKTSSEKNSDKDKLVKSEKQEARKGWWQRKT